VAAPLASSNFVDPPAKGITADGRPHNNQQPQLGVDGIVGTHSPQATT